MSERMIGSVVMNEQDDNTAKVNLLYHELGSLMGFQAQQVSNINERIGWLFVFSALNVSSS